VDAAALPGMWTEIMDRAVQDAAPMAARGMADGFKDTVRGRLGARGHAFSTKTPSKPGTPPAFISRRLLESVDTGPFAYSGEGAAWECHADTEYAAIQEWGGLMRAHTAKGMRWMEPPGVWHRSMAHRLPERSYFGSTVVLMEGDGSLRDDAIAGFLAADIFAGL
jgi:hypothetical protein